MRKSGGSTGGYGRMVFVFLAVAATILSGCAGRQEGGTQAAKESGSPAAEGNSGGGTGETAAADVTFQWKIEGDRLEGTLKASTQGWVAVGFDPSSMMKDADFIIAYVKDGRVSISDQFGSQLTQHKTDEELGGNSDVTAVNGSEQGGITQVTFTIPLNSGDRYDKALAAGESHSIILAYGNADDFTTRHVKAGKATVTL